MIALVTVRGVDHSIFRRDDGTITGGCSWAFGQVIGDVPLLANGRCANCVDSCLECGNGFDPDDDSLDWVSGVGLVCQPCRQRTGLATHEELVAVFEVES